MVGVPGVLSRPSRVGVTKLSLDRSDIAGFLNNASAHGVVGVMGRVTLDAGQPAQFVEHGIDHPEVETTFSVGVGGRLD